MTWHGRQGKGAKRELRVRRFLEAQARNKETPHENTKAHRKGKCDCE